MQRPNKGDRVVVKFSGVQSVSSTDCFEAIILETADLVIDDILHSYLVNIKYLQKIKSSIFGNKYIYATGWFGSGSIVGIIPSDDEIQKLERMYKL